MFLYLPFIRQIPNSQSILLPPTIFFLFKGFSRPQSGSLVFTVQTPFLRKCSVHTSETHLYIDSLSLHLYPIIGLSLHLNAILIAVLTSKFNPYPNSLSLLQNPILMLMPCSHIWTASLISCTPYPVPFLRLNAMDASTNFCLKLSILYI